MIYKYRWIAAIFISVLMFLSFYLYLFSPLLLRLHYFNDRDKELSKKIAHVKNLKNNRKISANPPALLLTKNAADNLFNLIFLLQANGLTVQSIKPLSAASMSSLPFDVFAVRAEAYLAQLFAFLDACANSSSLMTLLNFSFQSQEEKPLQLAFNILFLKNALTISSSYFLKKEVMQTTSAYPFCSESSFSLSPHSSDSLMELHSMRWIGYLQHGLQKKAFILLPNGNVISVKPGSILGKEHGMVLDVLKNSITIMLPDKKTWIIRK